MCLTANTPRVCAAREAARRRAVANGFLGQNAYDSSASLSNEQGDDQASECANQNVRYPK